MSRRDKGKGKEKDTDKGKGKGRDDDDDVDRYREKGSPLSSSSEEKPKKGGAGQSESSLSESISEGYKRVKKATTGKIKNYSSDQIKASLQNYNTKLSLLGKKPLTISKEALDVLRSGTAALIQNTFLVVSMRCTDKEGAKIKLSDVETVKQLVFEL